MTSLWHLSAYSILCVAMAADACGGRSNKTVPQDPMGAASAGTSGTGATGGIGGSDPCGEGRQAYAERRAELMNGYEGTCKNDTDCALVVEDNACAYDCAVSVPKPSSSLFLDTLNTLATEECTSCSAPDQKPCGSQMAICFVRTCVALTLQSP